MRQLRATSSIKAHSHSIKKRLKVLSRELPKKTEAELLKEAKAFLGILKTQGLLTFRRIHVMPVQIGFKKFRPNTDMSGMEDLQVYLLNGRTLFLELKSVMGRQSLEQANRERELKKLGHFYSIIRSIEQLILVLKQNGLNTLRVPMIK